MTFETFIKEVMERTEKASFLIADDWTAKNARTDIPKLLTMIGYLLPFYIATIEVSSTLPENDRLNRIARGEE